MNSSINRARIHNVSRIYHTAKDAARAMGISPVHYHRLCREYGIETPAERKRREKIERRRPAETPLSRTQVITRQAEWDYMAEGGR